MVIIITYYLIAAWFILLVFYNILSHEKYKQRQKFNTYIDAIYEKKPLVVERVHNPIRLKIAKRETFITKYSQKNQDLLYTIILKDCYESLFEQVKKYVKDNVQVDNIKGEINVELELTIYDTRPKWRANESPSIRRIESSNNS